MQNDERNDKNKERNTLLTYATISKERWRATFAYWLVNIACMAQISIFSLTSLEDAYRFICPRIHSSFSTRKKACKIGSEQRTDFSIDNFQLCVSWTIHLFAVISTLLSKKKREREKNINIVRWGRVNHLVPPLGWDKNWLLKRTVHAKESGGSGALDSRKQPSWTQKRGGTTVSVRSMQLQVRIKLFPRGHRLAFTYKSATCKAADIGPIWTGNWGGGRVEEAFRIALTNDRCRATATIYSMTGTSSSRSMPKRNDVPVDCVTGTPRGTLARLSINLSLIIPPIIMTETERRTRVSVACCMWGEIKKNSYNFISSKDVSCGVLRAYLDGTRWLRFLMCRRYEVVLGLSFLAKYTLTCMKGNICTTTREIIWILIRGKLSRMNVSWRFMSVGKTLEPIWKCTQKLQAVH